jgi:pyruvate/2-oxoglutarate dehydrogenase complex dihydrolipoamide dehydrogenase (E3) component
VLRREGVRMVFGDWTLKRVEQKGGEKLLHMERDGEKDVIAADELLVATGRSPNVQGLGLEAAGVEYDARGGVVVDETLRTSNPDIYAAGDICLKYKFTHTADASARVVIQNALFMGRKKLSVHAIPWCTFTDPEVAHVGMYEESAQAQGIPVDTFMRRSGDIDRAVLEGEEEDGFVKIHVKRGTDRILGATIVGAHAGEMISEITLAMEAGLGLKALSETIHPYPTRSEAIKKVADDYSRTRLTPAIRRVLARWLEFKRRT